MSRRNGLLTTVGKFGPGSVIGAASLMTGTPCENVIAADEVIACAISDQHWNDSIRPRRPFATGATLQLWPAELLGLLEVLDQRSAEADQVAVSEAWRCAAKRRKMCPNSQRCRDSPCEWSLGVRHK